MPAGEVAKPPRDMTRPQLTVTEGLARLPGSKGERFVELFRHGTLSVELYAPRGTDPQEPHSRDEVYAVASGSGWFRNGHDRHRFGPGDVLFVPAHAVHRFEDFSDDLAVWVFFYGPEGGESDP
jgi:mannose-6-phosphate isomerase-like protein (cupin superfamily)